MAFPGIIGQVLVGAFIGALREQKVAEPTKVANRAVARLETDPVVVNEMNGEPWYQSRVIIGLLVSIVSQVLNGFGWTVLPDDIEYWTNLIASFGTVFGVVFALYGRVWRGLKPLGG